jgi:hypothetical protein
MADEACKDARLSLAAVAPATLVESEDRTCHELHAGQTASGVNLLR